MGRSDYSSNAGFGNLYQRNGEKPLPTYNRGAMCEGKNGKDLLDCGWS